MKDKKGFTLIELLAVIVVLAIIMVIATMQVNKTIKKSRQDAFNLSYESLKKEIKQRIVSGDEYLCYDAIRDNTDLINMTDFFANNFFSICGNGIDNGVRIKKENINGEEKGVYVTGPITDYGVSACQNIYDISDDYRLWVSYRAESGDVGILLSTKEGKFKGLGYKQGLVENVGKISTKTSSTLGKNLEIEYKNNKLANVSISMINSNDCTYDEMWNHFDNTNYRTSSYECMYRWNKNKVDNIKNTLQKAADNNNGMVTLKQACDALTNASNWE